MAGVDRTGPLSGIRVIELSGIGPGPFAAMLLGDMGADVIRVDKPTVQTGVIPASIHPLRRSRRSVVLDLQVPEGRDALLDLLATADIVIECYRPGVAERLGIGPSQCAARNPTLIYGRMTGWGQQGPLAMTAGHDINYLALSGALHAIGREGQPPTVPVNLLGDFGGGGVYLALGLLAALQERSVSGRGQVVDAAIVDGASSLATMLYGMLSADQWEDRRGVNILDSGAPWYDVYQTSDGAHMAVGAIEPQFFRELMRTLQLDDDPSVQHDRARWPELRESIARVFMRQSRDHWEATFAGVDACVTPVLSLTEAATHPHAISRRSHVDIAGVRQPAPAPRFSRTPSCVQSDPAAVGAHTVEVLTEWGVRNVDELLVTGVARQAD